MLGWQVALCVALCGGFGGLVNALTSDNGFVFPQKAQSAEGLVIWRPGIMGSVPLSMIAAFVSWGLYSTAAGQPVAATTDLQFTWAAAAGAVLVGVGGARWLTAEVDKTMLRATAAAVAQRDASGTLAAQVATLSPASALEAAGE